MRITFSGEYVGPNRQDHMTRLRRQQQLCQLHGLVIMSFNSATQIAKSIVTLALPPLVTSVPRYATSRCPHCRRRAYWPDARP